MRKKTLFLTFGLFALMLVASGCTKSSVPTSYYTEFAQCLKDNGAQFYGASWCPHCADQKEMFGDAVDVLPYVECALPNNPNLMEQACKDAGIESYPTWVFADGSRVTGVQTFEFLGEKTGCEVPPAPSS